MGFDPSKILGLKVSNDGFSSHYAGFKILGGAKVTCDFSVGYGGSSDYYIGKERAAHISHTGAGHDYLSIFRGGDRVFYHDANCAENPPIEESNDLIEKMLEERIMAGWYDNRSETLYLLKEAQERYDREHPKIQPSVIEEVMSDQGFF